MFIHDGKVYLSGLTADDRSADIKGQTRQVLAKIEKCLEKAGTDKEDLLTAQIWLKDIAVDFADMNEVWIGWTSPNAGRATAQCQLPIARILIEIIVTAAVPF